MTYLYYATESLGISENNRTIDSCYEFSLWKPGFTSLVPKGISLIPFGAWWMLHQFHVFANRDYSLFLARSNGKIVHRTCVFPRYFRFPFMAKDDLQIGDTWTREDHRGKGIAPFAIQQVLQLLGQPGRRFWYVTAETNLPSIRAAEKGGFILAGKGRRTKRFGVRAIGSFVIDS
jgi:RimJ/RimL family protein N-acetyltransferase